MLTFICIFINSCLGSEILLGIDSFQKFRFNTQITEQDMKVLQDSKNYGFMVVSLKKLKKENDKNTVSVIVERGTYHGWGDKSDELLNRQLFKRYWMPPPSYFGQVAKRKSSVSSEYEVGKIYSYPLEIFNYANIEIYFNEDFLYRHGISHQTTDYRFDFPNIDVKKDRVYFFDIFLDENSKDQHLWRKNYKVTFNEYFLEEYVTSIKEKDDIVLGILNRAPYKDITPNVQP